MGGDGGRRQNPEGRGQGRRRAESRGPPPSQRRPRPPSSRRPGAAAPTGRPASGTEPARPCSGRGPPRHAAHPPRGTGLEGERFRSGSLRFTSHRGKDSDSGRSAAPHAEGPPEAQLPAGRGAEGLPGSERPAAGPLPLSRRREHRAAPGAAPTSSERPNMHQPITSSAEAAPAAAAIFASGPSGLRRRARGRGGERGDCEGRGARAP